ncbi:hypothetical protein CK203_031165 [Vitis vinifera]|uniref:Uncharacterized protein n=1 Tax=Vitis vinifera TaxID=29760 RepID=A0A438J0D4_VITVI|nr:hypothetical protein CK203_031165 [Vitis vinifera]
MLVISLKCFGNSIEGKDDYLTGAVTMPPSEDSKAPILGTKPLPSIQEACFEVRSEESRQKVMLGKTSSTSSESSALATHADWKPRSSSREGQGLAASSGEKKEQQTSNNSTFFSKERVEIIQKPITQATSSQSTLTRVASIAHKETLLSWHGSFVGKKCKKVWRVAPLHIFWTVWKARNGLKFKDDVLSIQRLKYSFVFFFLV